MRVCVESLSSMMQMLNKGLEMRVKVLFVCAVASSVAMSAVWMPFSAPVCCGDINGDHCVNVFDLQTLVSQMLASTLPAREADVNNDGQVDVCDLQFILARLNAQTSSEELPLPGKKTPPGIIVTPDRFWMGADKGTAEVLHPNREETQALLFFHDESLAVLSPRTERYLYTLTENAPPFSA